MLERPAEFNRRLEAAIGEVLAASPAKGAKSARSAP
jgi:hypothetical protein